MNSSESELKDQLNKLNSENIMLKEDHIMKENEIYNLKKDLNNA